MKPWAWTGAGAGLYAMALAAFAPALLLDVLLADASDGRFRLAAAEGTVWSGAARAELRDDSGHAHWSAPVAWHLQPASLLSGRLDYRLETRPTASLSAISLSRARVELVDLDVRVPAAALAAGFPALAPWGMSGELQLVTERMHFGHVQAGGNATLHWRGAGSALSPVSPLGDYELRIDGQFRRWQGRLHTVAGPVQLRGNGGWQPGSPADFQANVSVPPELRQTLAPFLRLVAIERADGNFDWRLR